MENKDIVEALEQVPALVKAAETFKATSGHIVSSLADAVKQRPQAEIPESELQKISQTPCAPPDVDSFSKALVEKVAGDIGSTIKEKVDKAIDNMKKGRIRVFSGNYTGVNPMNPADTIDLNAGYTEHQYSSNPSFCYILKDVITVEN